MPAVCRQIPTPGRGGTARLDARATTRPRPERRPAMAHPRRWGRAITLRLAANPPGPTPRRPRSPANSSGRDRTRTCDIRLVRPALYRLSYPPDWAIRTAPPTARFRAPARKMPRRGAPQARATAAEFPAQSRAARGLHAPSPRGWSPRGGTPRSVYWGTPGSSSRALAGIPGGTPRLPDSVGSSKSSPFRYSRMSRGSPK